MKKNKQTWFRIFIFIAPNTKLFWPPSYFFFTTFCSIYCLLCLMHIYYLFYLVKIVQKVVMVKYYILQSPYVRFNVKVICLFRKLSLAFVLFFMNYIIALHISLVIFQITLILYINFSFTCTLYIIFVNFKRKREIPLKSLRLL